MAEKRPPNHIHPVLRVLLAIASLGSGVVAYFAIMRAHTPEVGGVAFVVLAGVLAVFAVIGRRPRRINWNGNSADFDPEATDKLVELLEGLPSDLKTSVAQAMAEAAPRSVNVQRAASEVSVETVFEAEVVSRLRRLGYVISSEVEMTNGVVDAVIVVGSLRYGVEALRRTVPLHRIRVRTSRARTANLAGLIVVLPNNADLDLYRATFGDDEYVWFYEIGQLARLRDRLGPPQ